MSEGNLPISRIDTFLVHPGKGNAKAKESNGASLPLKGDLYHMLKAVYERSESECDIGISFNHSKDGTQTNPVRSLISDYLGSRTIPKGRKLANRLRDSTNGVSGLGLLFLVSGKENGKNKIVISRFPAANAILAEEDSNKLSVEFLERVFMKSATAYKAVLYSDKSLTTGFWSGLAIDKQINNRETDLSNYWISNFLDSDFQTTSAAGTRRLAIALKNTIGKSDDLSIKQEITAAVTLAHTLAGKQTSVEDFATHFGLSNAAKAALNNQIRNPQLRSEKFRFETNEFANHLAFKSIELDSGAVMTAEISRFETVFERHLVDGSPDKYQYTSTGHVISEKIRKTK